MYINKTNTANINVISSIFVIFLIIKDITGLCANAADYSWIISHRD